MTSSMGCWWEKYLMVKKCISSWNWGHTASSTSSSHPEESDASSFLKGGGGKGERFYVLSPRRFMLVRTTKSWSVKVWLLKVVLDIKEVEDCAPATVELPTEGKDSELIWLLGKPLQGEPCRRSSYLIKVFGSPTHHNHHFPAQGHGLLRICRPIKPLWYPQILAVNTCLPQGCENGAVQSQNVHDDVIVNVLRTATFFLKYCYFMPTTTVAKNTVEMHKDT